MTRIKTGPKLDKQKPVRSRRKESSCNTLWTVSNKIQWRKQNELDRRDYEQLKMEENLEKTDIRQERTRDRQRKKHEEQERRKAEQRK